MFQLELPRVRRVAQGWKKEPVDFESDKSDTARCEYTRHVCASSGSNFTKRTTCCRAALDFSKDKCTMQDIKSVWLIIGMNATHVEQQKLRRVSSTLARRVSIRDVRSLGSAHQGASRIHGVGSEQLQTMRKFLSCWRSSTGNNFELEASTVGQW